MSHCARARAESLLRANFWCFPLAQLSFNSEEDSANLQCSSRSRMISSGVEHPGAAPADDKPPADETAGAAEEGEAAVPRRAQNFPASSFTSLEPISPLCCRARRAGVGSTTASFCKRTSSMRQPASQVGSGQSSCPATPRSSRFSRESGAGDVVKDEKSAKRNVLSRVLPRTFQPVASS